MNWLEKRWYSNQPAPFFLKPLSCLYRFLAEKKKKNDLLQQWQAPVPVIIVGNISVGGTGKTPVTLYLVELLRSEGYNPGIISRGYKSSAKHFPFDVSKATAASEAGDEPFMLHHKSSCPVVIDPDRPQAAQYLLDNYACDILISDDGLQHYRLGRDIEITVVDGQRGLGNHCLLPSGPLRELPDRLNSVDFVISNGKKANLDDKIEQYLMTLKPVGFRSVVSNEFIPAEDWAIKKVHAVAGIGNPDRFFSTLRDELGLDIVEHPKPDHHTYQQSDFCFTEPLPIIMTEKDAVKVKQLPLVDAWMLEVSACIDDSLKIRLLQALQQMKKVKTDG